MEEVEKKKRGRPRKTQLPKEIQKLVDEVQQKEEQEIKQIIQEVKEQHKGEWDVKKDDTIEFFDARLSYELTGYKPINKTQGLDFNPDWFTEARQTKIQTGHYTQYRKGTKAYSEFWNEEYRRCRFGMTSHGYTITGDNYFFLNYYQLLNVMNVSEAGAGRNIDFPQFSVAQYEYFHYLQMCRELNLNACLMKARGLTYQAN